MNINTKNYFDSVQRIGFKNLPIPLKETHRIIEDKTGKGRDWSVRNADPEFKEMCDLAFQKLGEYTASQREQLSGMENDLQELSGTSKKQEPMRTKKTANYSTIQAEVKFIQQFLNFHDKIIYKKTLEIFIDELQKAINNKKITKKSAAAKDIVEIQQAAVSAFNRMGNAKHFTLKPATIKRMKGILEKFENAYPDLDEKYIRSQKKPIPLNGLAGTEGQMMCSTDFIKMQFDRLGFTGKWLVLIGDPCRGFTVMVFGKPKYGKSYLCVDFAGYLAQSFGKVLYVAKEEKLDATLQEKLKEKEVAHPNLTVSDYLPADLSPYQFIFLDSVSKLGLSPQDLDKLKADNPGKSFIYVFQVTKAGIFRGENSFQHDVDVVIDVPEKGKAIQFGRFNQGGEMDIFPDAEPEQQNKAA